MSRVATENKKSNITINPFTADDEKDTSLINSGKSKYHHDKHGNIGGKTPQKSQTFSGKKHKIKYVLNLAAAETDKGSAADAAVTSYQTTMSAHPVTTCMWSSVVDV